MPRRKARPRKSKRFMPYPMSDVDRKKELEEFAATGRTGRRNALPDIMSCNHAATSTADLPVKMEALRCSDDESKKSDTACSDPKNQSDQSTSSSEGDKNS